MASEVTGKPLSQTRELKQAAMDLLISGYGKLPAARQQGLTQVPALWATLRLAWPTMPEADKASLRQQWRQQLLALVPRSKEDVAAEKAQQRLQALIQKAQQGGSRLSPAELKAGAGEMETIAAALRQQGGSDNQAMAARTGADGPAVPGRRGRAGTAAGRPGYDRLCRAPRGRCSAGAPPISRP
jgi:hypothetical protein